MQRNLAQEIDDGEREREREREHDCGGSVVRLRERRRRW